ncbi:gliding motility-associated C-terminal domain-containing protein [Aurantibacter crassamenti]|uniref:gliding motility-associated C-terminal domain-containing protein n=1 Tax=Aurantibacter crassamenti TaxID=1837375 RepID=UPI0019394CFB|nr:gliding motility-associated C-terminal domain-containing protein [Aurantibacter crassamenti]MBM1107967.1 gliding motility-associated C-terminal domain-containing protein [Aurantibacter crassamenti]
MDKNTTPLFSKKAYSFFTFIVAFVLLGLSSSFGVSSTFEKVEPMLFQSPTDTDGDGVPDSVDIDDDNDGILDTDECTTLELKEVFSSDFGFSNGVSNGNLSYSDLDISSKWGLPAGSIIVSVTGASTSSTGPFFSVGNNLPATFTFSGTTPVHVVARHSPNLAALSRDGIVALDGTIYNQTTTLPDGIVEGSSGNDYYVENITNSGIDEPERATWVSQSTVSEIQFYTNSDHVQNGIRLYLQPTACPDTDGDGTPDNLDIDADDDGIPDNVEAQPTDGYIPPSGNDSDNDGLDDAYEGAGDEGLTPINTDGTDTPDYIDLDSDNDLVPDNNEGNDFNYDGIPDQVYTGIDTDGDGLDDGYEGSDVNDGYDVNDEIDDPANDLPDTDGTEDVNYRDIDDDGDNINTIDEDANNDGDPTNDDTDGDGTPDYLDPIDDNTPETDTDGDGVPDSTDLDDDNDGILDTVEDANLDSDNDPLTNPTDTDGDGYPNHLDIDADNDGIPDNVEAQTTVGYIAPNEDDAATYEANNGLNSAYLPDGLTPVNHDKIDTPDYIDLDSDNDLVPDNNEGNDFNYDGIPDQVYLGTDTDGDGLDDGYEGSDLNDGFDVNDEIDDPANDLPDTDGTEDVNYRDFDDDGDGIDTPDEDANNDGDPTNDDTDGDGTPDYLDPIDDSTPDTDTDGDGVPDSTDLDDDNDGILDTVEDPNTDGDNDPLTNPLDSDGDGYPNHLDIDADNDGIPDNVEAQTTDGYIAPNEDDAATYEANNGLNSAYLPDGLVPNNHDGADTPDYIDLDSDNDLVPDNNEGNDFNYDGIPDQTYLGTDTDGDGLDDGYEGSNLNDGFDVNDEINDPANDLPDTDGTEDVNYRDIDDDGDGIDTPDEDANNDGDPTNDDSNGDGIPDYLDPKPLNTDIVVMQMVTPNGDGKNEFLWIENVHLALNNNLRIFNRWGIAVYEGENYNNQNNVFDGRSKGRSTLSAGDYLPAGVYFYIFEYNTANENDITNSGYIYISE